MSQLSQRRHFLKLLSAGAISAGLPLAGCTHKKFYHPDEDIFLSGGRYTERGSEHFALVSINMTQTEKRVVDIPFLAHEILIDPTDKYRIICLEKNGKKACEVNLQTQKLVSEFSSETDSLFSGHGVFSQDGKIIYCIENHAENNQGTIIVRDARSFKAIEHITTHGYKAHDCQRLENILVVSNTGSENKQAFLSYIDLTTNKQIKQLKLDNKLLNSGHFHIDSTDSKVSSTVITSAPIDEKDNSLPGGVSIKVNAGEVSTMNEPDVVIKRMTGEALGIAVNRQHHVAAITHPMANLLTFWSIKDKKIIKAIGIENPRGISQALDKQSFVISYGSKAAMAKISTDTLEPQADSIVQPTFTSGEHLMNWSQTLREIMPKRIYG